MLAYCLTCGARQGQPYELAGVVGPLPPSELGRWGPSVDISPQSQQDNCTTSSPSPASCSPPPPPQKTLSPAGARLLRQQAVAAQHAHAPGMLRRPCLGWLGRHAVHAENIASFVL